MSVQSLQEVEQRFQQVLARIRQERSEASASRCRGIAEAHDRDGMTFEEIGKAIGIHHSLAVRMAAKGRAASGRRTRASV
jgi:hypothetical protein